MGLARGPGAAGQGRQGPVGWPPPTSPCRAIRGPFPGTGPEGDFRTQAWSFHSRGTAGGGGGGGAGEGCSARPAWASPPPAVPPCPILSVHGVPMGTAVKRDFPFLSVYPQTPEKRVLRVTPKDDEQGSDSSNPAAQTRGSQSPWLTRGIAGRYLILSVAQSPAGSRTFPAAPSPLPPHPAAGPVGRPRCLPTPPSAPPAPARGCSGRFPHLPTGSARMCVCFSNAQ